MRNSIFVRKAGGFAVLTAVSMFAGTALAAPATLTMTNGDGGGGAFNTTFFTITSDTSPGVSVTGFSMTIGDSQYLFDFLYSSREAFVGGNGSQTATLLIGDRTDNGTGQGNFAYGFTNFGPGVRFDGQWDIDNTNGDFNADARTVLFNNGAAANAVVSLAFSDGTVLDYTLPDGPIASEYSFAIPTPGGAVVLVGAMLVAGRRRRR